VFELGELGAGFDAKFVDEVASGLLVGTQSVGLSAAVVQRQHQLGPQSFV
jgi:hypothetical protein